MSNRTQHIIIFVVALTVRLALLSATGGDEARFRRPDSPSYEDPAASLLVRGTFSGGPEPGAGPELCRTPGYPVLIALVHRVSGPSILPLVLFQIVLSVAACGLALMLARRIAPEGPCWIAPAIVALDLPSACHALLVLSETLFAVLAGLALVLFWSAARPGGDETPRPILKTALAALVLGLAVLVRPIGLYLVPLAVPWLLLAAPGPARRRVSLAVLALVLGLALPLAWMARNHAAGGGFALCTIEGDNLLYYRAAPVLARVQGIGWGEVVERLRAEQHRRQAGPELGVPAATLMRRMALEILMAYPVQTAVVFGQGALSMWAGPGTTDLMILLGTSPVDPASPVPTVGSPARKLVGWLGVLFGCATRIVLVPLMAIGLLSWAVTRRRAELSFVLGVLLAITVLSAGPGAYSRLRIPVTGLAAVAVVAGVHAIAARIRRPDRGTGLS